MKLQRTKECTYIYIRASLDKIEFNAEYIKRIFNISKWLDTRYSLNSDDCEYDHTFLGDDAKNNLITIRLKFYGK